MCASVFPQAHKNIEGVFVGIVVPLILVKCLETHGFLPLPFRIKTP